MEEKEIACVERFVKEMEEYGYHFSVNISEAPSEMSIGKMTIGIGLKASKLKPNGEPSWREVAIRFAPRC
jgi:hypothetical protein